MQFTTLAQAIACVGRAYPDNGFTFQDQRGRETFFAFAQIEAETAWRAGALRAVGLECGARVGMVILEPEDFVLTFLAAVRLGAVPVPIFQPRYLGEQHAYRREVARILNSSGASTLLVSAELLDILHGVAELVPTLEHVVPLSALRLSDAPPAPLPQPDDIAFLQFTSGSTTEPRGVAVTHRALLSNIEAFMSGLEVDSRQDKALTWLPLFHDMGLIAFVLATFVWGTSVVLIPTSRFIKRPSVWLGSISRHRAALTSAPNFAYALATQHVSAENLEEWDLSCLKMLGCGAEPIRADTIARFSRLFSQRCKLNPDALVPAYGLAEATLVVAMKRPVRQPMRSRLVDRTMFQQTGVAHPAVLTDGALEHVSCGPPVSGTEVAITDTDGNHLSPGVEGQICVRGPSLGAGYFRQPEASAAAWRDGWLQTGDLGYLWDDELYVTGRSKDLIILNGRNYHPQAIEWALEGVNGVRAGNAVAFSRPGSIGEELVVVVETRSRDIDQLIADVDGAVRGAIFQRPADIVCVPRGSLPKTTSGKLKRSELRRRYLNTGLLDMRLTHGSPFTAVRESDTAGPL